MTKTKTTLSVFAIIAIMTVSAMAKDRVEIKRDDSKGKLEVLIDGQQALVYQYDKSFCLPHYWPLNSPSGKNMLVQKTQPYPHHRSLWFADTVRFPGGESSSFYNAYYSGEFKPEDKDKEKKLREYFAPFAHYVAHTGFKQVKTDGDKAIIESSCQWIVRKDKPILDECRSVTLKALADGEYFLDMKFKLTANYGDVEFVSDSVHYAWPYIRLNKTFNGQTGGGIITNDSGQTGQKNTNGKVSKWMDYSCKIGNKTEGLAIFQWPDGHEHTWLTREYGCFGPRRKAEQNGKKFTLKKGNSITQRVGILVHNGNVKTGDIAQRYQEYINDKILK